MNIIVYLLQVSATLGFFYALYYLILRKLTFFTINRWFLLTMLAFSFITPLLTISVHAEFVQAKVYFTQFQHSAALKDINIKNSVGQAQTNWFGIITVAYSVIATALFIRLIVAMVLLFRKTTLHSSTKVGNVHIVRGNKKIGNGSFLNYIFLKDEKLAHDEIRQIIQHEMLHIKLLHSLDRTILELSKVVLWFNPFIYLYSRSVEENHEFEVDNEICRLTDKNTYANLLLKLSIANQSTFYNTFSKIPLENRITMLFNKPTKNMKKLIYVLVLPIGVISCLAFASVKNEKKGIVKRQTDSQFRANYTPQPNLKAETSISPFYTRIHITENGKTFDKVTFSLVDGAASANLGTHDQLGVFIDGTFYNEEEVKKLPVEKTASLTFDRSEGAMNLHKIPSGNYAIPFCFKTLIKR